MLYSIKKNQLFVKKYLFGGGELCIVLWAVERLFNMMCKCDRIRENV